MPRDHRHHRVADLSPAVRCLIRAAAHEAQVSAALAARGDADALAAFARLAAVTIPVHGLLGPPESIEPELNRIVRSHFACARARREFKVALERVRHFEQRDAIDVAHNQIVAIAEHTYYLAGLAFGITWIERISR